MNGRVHFAGWCSNHHLVETTTSADIYDGDTYMQSCGACGRPTYLDRVPDDYVGKPTHEYAVFHPPAAEPIPLDGQPFALGPCVSRGYLTPALALRYADPGQLVAVMCSHGPAHDLPMAACADCRDKHPAAAHTVLVKPHDTDIHIEFTRLNGNST